MSLLVCLFFLLFHLGYSSAAAPDQETTLSPVVVTATRMETAEKQVPGSITVITAEDLQAQQAVTVYDALRHVPAVDVVQSGSRGNPTSVFIRGSESDHVLVLIDGVEVNSPTLGSFDFAHLTTDNIERIEVLRGSGGTLYGSQAIGGVINIITKRGEGTPELTISAEGGNGRTFRQRLSLTGGQGKWSYSFSAGRLQSAGFQGENDDYRNLTTAARVDYRAIEDATLTGIFHFAKSDVGFVNNNNFVPAPDPNAREARTQFLGKLEWQQRILPQWDYRFSGALNKEHLKDSDDVDSCTFFGFPCDTRTRDRFRPQIRSGEFQTNYRIGEWSTTSLGVDHKLRKASTSGGIDESIWNVGSYLQQQLRLFDQRLVLIPGLRIDHNQTFGSALTPAFSWSYLFRETATRLKGSYAEGFKAPTLNEQFFPAAFGCPAFGNPDLDPEQSWEFNVGVEQDLVGDRVKLGATYFHREVEDLIEGRPIPGDPFGCFRAQNVGRARFDGIEWSLAAKLLPALLLKAHYTYLDWDTADGKLRRRARHRGGVGLNYLHERWTLNATVNIVGRRDDFRAASPFGDVVKPGYTRFDVSGSYRLPLLLPLVKNLSVIGKIENLFNRKYQEADGFPARPFNFLIGLQGVFGKQTAP